jgi:hypothetical protein
MGRRGVPLKEHKKIILALVFFLTTVFLGTGEK